jgi:hypothetical protein
MSADVPAARVMREGAAVSVAQQENRCERENIAIMSDCTPGWIT